MTQKLVNGQLVDLTSEEEAARTAEKSANFTASKLPHLVAYREAKISAGITVNGVKIKGDEKTVSRLGNARIEASSNSNFTAKWSAENGSFTLTAAQIISLHTAGVNFINNCFNAFDTVKTDIDDYTTLAQIEAAFDAAYEAL